MLAAVGGSYDVVWFAGSVTAGGGSLEDLGCGCCDGGLGGRGLVGLVERREEDIEGWQ